MSKNVVSMAIAGLALLGSSVVFAVDCPLEPYKDGESHVFLPPGGPHSTGVYTSVDDEFGVGAQANTECVNKQGKLVIQVDANKDAAGAAPWLSTYGFFVRNYEIQGIEAGKDVEIAVVLSASGAYLGTNGNVITNPTSGAGVINDAGNIARVKDAIARGFKVYVCQTAARGLGIKQSDLIEGVKFTPGGHLMVIDLQMNGYAHMMYK